MPAKLDQPTIVKNSIEDLVKTIINSNIISKSKEVDNSNIGKQNFKNLLNVFDSESNEEMEILLSTPWNRVVKRENIYLRQQDTILLRWAAYIIKSGITVMQK